MAESPSFEEAMSPAPTNVTSAGGGGGGVPLGVRRVVVDRQRDGCVGRPAGRVRAEPGGAGALRAGAVGCGELPGARLGAGPGLDPDGRGVGAGQLAAQHEAAAVVDGGHGDGAADRDLAPVDDARSAHVRAAVAREAREQAIAVTEGAADIVVEPRAAARRRLVDDDTGRDVPVDGRGREEDRAVRAPVREPDAAGGAVHREVAGQRLHRPGPARVGRAPSAGHGPRERVGRPRWRRRRWRRRRRRRGGGGVTVSFAA